MLKVFRVNVLKFHTIGTGFNAAEYPNKSQTLPSLLKNNKIIFHSRGPIIFSI